MPSKSGDRNKSCQHVRRVCASGPSTCRPRRTVFTEAPEDDFVTASMGGMSYPWPSTSIGGLIAPELERRSLGQP